MIPAVVVAAVVSLQPFAELPTDFWGVVPEVKAADVPDLCSEKRKHDRAVVLVHGLWAHPFHPERAERPEPHEWQVPTAPLVKALADDADVFAFSYAQTVPLDGVVLSRGLREGVAALKRAGYEKVTLVGHSAGGVISRRFVEAFPDAGVTKVVSVAGPHLGSIWAKMPSFTVPKFQQAFVRSMLPDFRDACEKECVEVRLPKDVEACCVVCKVPRLSSDTTVSLASQWPLALQKQGVPAVLVGCNHFDAMTCDRSIAAIAEVVQGKVVRWTPEQVEKAQAALFGERKK